MKEGVVMLESGEAQSRQARLMLTMYDVQIWAIGRRRKVEKWMLSAGRCEDGYAEACR
jgi:hypothetical protein